METQKPQANILRETKRIGIGVALGLAVMFVVYALMGKMTLGVLLGGLIGGAYAVLNFFLLGMNVQKVAQMRVENEELARMQMRTSYNMRMIGMVVIVIAAFAIPFIDGLACLIPMAFPRLTILGLQVTGQIKDE